MKKEILSFFCLFMFLLSLMPFSSQLVAVVNDQIIPTAGSGHDMVYVTSTEEIILFGGFKDNYNTKSSYLNDTWKYSYSQDKWEEIPSTETPHSRSSSELVYDPLNDRVLLYGGINNVESYNDTWELNLATYEWSEIQTITSPGLSADVQMVYDEFNQEIVLFGAFQPTGYFDETWIFDVSNDNWTKLDTPIHPSGRYGHRMVYCAYENAIYLFAGHAFDISDTINNDLWRYDCPAKQWSEVIDGTPPPMRYWHDMSYDQPNNRIILYGGRLNQFSFSCHDDTWEYDVEANEWNQIDTDNNPEARMDHSMIFHSAENKIILFGGCENPFNIIYNDTWIFDTENNQWYKIELSTEESPVSLISGLIVFTILSWTFMFRRKSERS